VERVWDWETPRVRWRDIAGLGGGEWFVSTGGGDNELWEGSLMSVNSWRAEWNGWVRADFNLTCYWWGIESVWHWLSTK
jgi:hypothetical protein